MKVLTVKTKETVSPEIQREIHSILRMEFQTDYVFKDLEDGPYSATISIDQTGSTEKTILENSAKLPEYTLVVNILEMETNSIEHKVIKNGKIIEEKSGGWVWNEE